MREIVNTKVEKHITLALHKASNKLLHIDEVENGLDCKCICVECEGVFEAVQGKIIQHHFRHHIKSNCTGGLETALHLLAKEILVGNNKIQIFPNKEGILYREAKAEKKLKIENEIDYKIPDVSAKLESGDSIFFEIVVTNPISEKKRNYYKNGKHLSIQIDLRNLLQNLNSYKREEISNAVLKEVDNKKIIYWHPKSVIEQSSDWLAYILPIGGFLGILMWLFSNKKSKSKTSIKYKRYSRK